MLEEVLVDDAFVVSMVGHVLQDWRHSWLNAVKSVRWHKTGVATWQKTLESLQTSLFVVVVVTVVVDDDELVTIVAK